MWYNNRTKDKKGIIFMRFSALQKKCKFISYLNSRISLVNKWQKEDKQKVYLQRLNAELEEQTSKIEKYIDLFSIGVYSFVFDICEYFQKKHELTFYVETEKVQKFKSISGGEDCIYQYQIKLTSADFRYEIVLVPNVLYAGEREKDGECLTPRINLFTEGYITKPGASSPLYLAKSFFSVEENPNWQKDLDDAVWYAIEQNIKRKIRISIDETDEHIADLRDEIRSERRRLHSLEVEKIKPVLTNLDCLIK